MTRIGSRQSFIALFVANASVNYSRVPFPSSERWIGLSSRNSRAVRVALRIKFAPRECSVCVPVANG